MRTLEYGTRTAHISLTAVELKLVIDGLILVEEQVGDPHEFLDRTGTSPEHLTTLAGELLSLRRRMRRLGELDARGQLLTLVQEPE